MCDDHPEELASNLGVDKEEVNADLKNLVEYIVPVDEAKESLRRKHGFSDGGIPVDLCQPVPGDQGRECPDSAVSVYEIPIPRDVANVTIRGSGTATVVGSSSSVSVEVSGVRNDVLAAETMNGTLSFSETYRNLSPSGSSDELTLGIETTGLAGARLDGVTIWKDTDGDGLTDQREQIGFPTMRYGHVSTDPTEADTDAETLDDGREVGDLELVSGSITLAGQSQSFQHEYYIFNSNPRAPDTDYDGLNDSIEAGNWTVEVVNRSGTMYSWNSTADLAPGEPRETVNFSSSPHQADSDGDGLTDYQEKERYHTDPESRVTYEITREHQREIIGTFQHIREENNCEDRYECSNRVALRAMGFITNDPSTMDRLDDLDGFQLTDRTDDFDFVVPDDYADRDEQWSRFSFRSLDTNGITQPQIYRTDVWLPNGFESSVRLTDPWDPDTDDDGLTDGQETRGMTRIAHPETFGNPAPYEAHLDQPVDDTYPHLADSDGDGWWDGWIGVYGVGRTDNVILYREHLASGDGVTGHETVPEQAGIHNVSGRTPGVDVDSDRQREHSNIHVGELQFGTDTRHAGDVPDPTYSAEIDVYEGDPNAIDVFEERWTDAIEANFALYGIDVTLYRSDRLTADQMRKEWQCAGASTLLSVLGPSWGPIGSLIAIAGSNSACVEPEGGFTLGETAVIEYNHRDRSTDDYIFIGDDPGPALDGTGHAINYFKLPIIGIYTDPVLDENFNATDIRRSPYNNEAEYALASVLMHEIGHSFKIGRADDATSSLNPSDIVRYFEVYSGDEGENTPDDDTPEHISPNSPDEWSLMAETSGSLATSPMNGRYFAFSLEELMTVDEP